MTVEQIYEEVIDRMTEVAPKIGSAFPHVGQNGKWDDMLRCDPAVWPHGITWWTNGYWPGMMWQMYDITKNEMFRTIAEECEDKLDEAFDIFRGLQHDVGFMWGDSAVASYNLTGNERSKIRASHAATLLAGRYNIKWGAMASWNRGEKGKTIIDGMMNLRLLCWAARELCDPRFKHIATAHADKMLKTLIRPDATAYHMCDFDAESGKLIEFLGGTGYSTDSQWSRGQAWTIYGYTRMFESTGDEKYLETAKKCADNFIKQCKGKTPAWDFCLPEGEEFIPDTSAGACAASAMITMADYLQDKEIYINAARSILIDMYENYKSCGEPLLTGGTGNKPAGRNVNVSLIYGDFYFLEALRKLCDENYRNIFA